MLTMGRRKFRLLHQKATPARQPPFRQEERIGGCRRGAGSQAPLQGARSKESPGGRPSAGEVPQSLPPAEDPWSLAEPLATALPHRRRPGFRLSLMALEWGARRGPHLAV